ncbi:Protein TOXD, partial [Lachnellula suecica]
MKAVIIKERGKASLVDIKEQAMRPDYIKVKTVAVAVNPTDYHHTAATGLVGGILGCDLSGIVEEVGKDCKSEVKKGDAVFENNAEDGAFAEFAMVKDGHIAKIPEGMSFEEAATFGTGSVIFSLFMAPFGSKTLNSCQTLYMTLKLPLPTEPTKEPLFILINGGSSATGTLAIQYAKLSGLTVLTTCSPHNNSLVTSRGADAVFNYHDPTCASQIRAYSNNNLHYILDTICTPSSFKTGSESFPKQSKEALKLVALLPLEGWERTDVDATVTLAYTTFGEAFAKYGAEFPANEEHY